MFIEEQGIHSFRISSWALLNMTVLMNLFFDFGQVGSISPFDFSYEAHVVFPEDVLIETI
jgi:hypothetical protein